MPERFNLAALLEVADDRAIRSDLLRCIANTFGNWLSEPTEVLLLDCHSSNSQRTSWQESADVRTRVLAASEIMSIFYDSADKSKNGKFALSISANSSASVYTISFPDIDVAKNRNELCHLLIELYLSISNFGVHCVVVAGPELEIDHTALSITDVIICANENNSLIEFLSCEKDTLPIAHKFLLMQRRDSAAVYMRDHRL